MVGERHSEIGRPESDSSVQGGGEGELFLSKSSREKKKEKKRNASLVARKKMRNSTETSPRSSLARNNRWSETGLAESTNIGFNKAHKSCIRLHRRERRMDSAAIFVLLESCQSQNQLAPKPAFLFPWFAPIHLMCEQAYVAGIVRSPLLLLLFSVLFLSRVNVYPRFANKGKVTKDTDRAERNFEIPWKFYPNLLSVV